MGEKTGDRVVNQTNRRWHEYLLEVRVKCERCLEKNDQKSFRKNLQKLFRQMFWQFENSSEVERPEWSYVETGEDQITPKNVENLNAKRCLTLYSKCMELQDKLGFTTVGQPNYNKRDIGVKK